MVLNLFCTRIKRKHTGGPGHVTVINVWWANGVNVIQSTNIIRAGINIQSNTMIGREYRQKEIELIQRRGRDRQRVNVAAIQMIEVNKCQIRFH